MAWFGSGSKISSEEISAPLSPLSEAAPADVSRLLRLEDEGEAARSRSNQRMRVVAYAMVAAFAVIAIQSVKLALSSQGLTGGARAEALNIDITRRDIVDRNGEILAQNLDFHSLYADPALVWDPAGTARALVTVLPQLDVEETTRRLDRNARFVWLARKLTPRQRQAVHALGLAGIGFRVEPGRIYPRAATAAHLLGYTNSDLQGVAGLELALNEELQSGSSEPVALSIDLTVQNAIESILAQRMARYNAVAASATLMRVGTGEVVAMASLPDFDPNRPSDAGDAELFNRPARGVYELGSVFKPLTLAAALETGEVELTDIFDATDPLRVGGRTIHDFHPERRPLTARETIIHSSNIATSRIADKIGTEALRSFFGDLHLWERAPIELAESASPLEPQRWGRIQTMTASFGHGFNVSPVALTTAYAALANGGVYVPPTLRKVEAEADIFEEPVMSAHTAAQVLGVMRQVVIEGSGGQADVQGLAIAGKTGTAERVVNGVYDTDSLFTSFIAIFPFDDPQYVLLVTLDQPQSIPETHGFATAGWNAAPTAGEIVERVAPILRVPLRNGDTVRQASVIEDMFAPRPGVDRNSIEDEIESDE